MLNFELCGWPYLVTRFWSMATPFDNKIRAERKSGLLRLNQTIRFKMKFRIQTTADYEVHTMNYLCELLTELLAEPLDYRNSDQSDRKTEVSFQKWKIIPLNSLFSRVFRSSWTGVVWSRPASGDPNLSLVKPSLRSLEDVQIHFLGFLVYHSSLRPAGRPAFNSLACSW